MSARAQEREIFTWTGRVDREVRLTVSPTRSITSPEAAIRSRTRFRMTSAMPQRPGILHVVANQGRGNVNVIQQPSAQNGYAAIVQILDAEGGADNYRLTAHWTSNEDPRYSRNNRSRRGDDDRGRRGDDDRYDNGSRSNPQLLQWSGDVDGEIHLVWRNGAVRIEQGSGAAPQRVRSTVSGSTNQVAGQIALAVRDGRGRIDVIQQPSAQNNYTGVIRIQDPQSGYGHYTFDATWR